MFKNGYTAILLALLLPLAGLGNAGLPLAQDTGFAGSMQPYDNLRITDWLDDDTFVFAADQRLSLFNMTSGTETPLVSQPGMRYEAAKFSPDKQYVAYIRYAGQQPRAGGTDMSLCLMNMRTRGEIVLYQNIRSFIWTGGSIVFDGWGATYLADTSGSVRNISEATGGYYRDGAVFVEDGLYFIERENTSTTGGSLYRYDAATGGKRLLKQSVETFVLSPDGKQAAALIRQGDTGAYLAVLALSGMEKTVIARKSGPGVMMRAAWSPDGQTVAYTVMTGTGRAVNSLYLFDTATGRSTRVAANVDDPELAWSPSGGKLAIAGFTGAHPVSRVVYLHTRADH